MAVKAKAIIERDKKDYYNDFVMDMTVALHSAANDIRTYLTTMPPKTAKHLHGPLPGGFYTVKQKRYVHWALGQGVIVAPYQRTGDLARSWTIDSVAISGGLAVQIYQDPSLAPYGKYVQNPKVREPMHEDWPDIDKAEQDMGAEAVGKLRKVAEAYGFR